MDEFIVYSKDGCPFCVKAINLLKMKKKTHKEMKLDRDIDRNSLLEAIQYYGHGRTMPMIVQTDDGSGNTVRIGGYDELVKYFQENK